MNKERVEHNELIATRVVPGDRWALVGDPKKEVFKTLTDASKLYAIQEHEYEVKKEEPKMYSLYGEFKQGI